LGHSVVCRLDDVIRAQGLGEIVVCSQPHRLFGGLNARVTRDNDDFTIGPTFLDDFEDVHAVQIRHAKVEQDDIEWMLLHGAQRLVATLYDLRIAIGADKAPKVAESYHFFVIYYEDTGPVVHLITSHSCLTLSDAINVPETIKPTSKFFI
jgi:hypothetical protein